MTRNFSFLMGILLVLSVVVTACGAGTGAPSTPGQYDVQKGSVHFDGDRYELYWSDSAQGGALHHMQTHNLRLVRDPDRTSLEVPQGGGDPILHLREDEPITVYGQDHQGAFSSPWFPFLLGATLGNVFGRGGRGGQTVIINNPAPGETRTYDAGTPTYRYPPTGSFGRDEELHGSLDTSKPQVPDYSRVQPAPYATSGKSSGTGGGAAASNKSAGAPSGVGGGAVNATSGQTGGTGGGTAASGKGGFATGSQSYTNTNPGTSGVGAGSRGVLGGGSSSGSSSKPSTGIGGGSSSGSKGIGGARAPSIGGKR